MNNPVRVIAIISLWCFASMTLADINVKSDVVYGHKDGMALVYHVLSPENANGAAVVYMVSGGWFSRWAPAERTANRFTDLLDAGFTLIPVHHGSSPRYHVPDAYADVSRAIRHSRLNGDDYGIDTDRIGVTGGSAGGHLSLMLGLDADDGDKDAEDEIMRVSNKVAAVVAYYPPVDLRRMTGPSRRFPALDFANELAASISPILHADPQDPPTLLIHGDEDTLVNINHSVIMQAEFERQKITSNFITILGAGHGFRGDDAVKASKERLNWFNKYLVEQHNNAD